MREHSRGRNDVHLVAADTRRSAPVWSTAGRRPHGSLTQIGFIVAVMLWSSTSACASLLRGRTNTTGADASDAWPSSLAAARSLALERKFNAADSVLARFATRYPSTPQATETAYWRGLFKMDPANPNGALPTAISLLDGYLGSERARDHIAEATTMRRIAAKLGGLTRVAESAVTEAKEASNTAANAKAEAANANARAEAAKGDAGRTEAPSSDAEIKRLKDELAKANAELDRIRKRLTNPPQKP